MRSQTSKDGRPVERRAAVAVVALIALVGTAAALLGPPDEANAPRSVARPDDGSWRALGEEPRARARGLLDVQGVHLKNRVVVVAQASYARDRVEALAYDLEGRRWRWAAPSPLRHRFGASVVGTGSQAIVWGGATAGGPHGDARARSDGATYDPGLGDWKPWLGAWKRMASPPIAARSSHTAVWTGERMIVWGGVGEQYVPGRTARLLNDGAAYDPGRDRWTRIAPAPLRPRHDHVAVWTGKRMIIWGGLVDQPRHGGAPLVTDGAAYDPVRNRWAKIRRAPVRSMPDMQAVWTGETMVVSGASKMVAYRPSTGRWETLPRYPWGRPRLGSTLTWTGEEVVLWGGARGPCGDCYLLRGEGATRTDGLAYRDGRWRLLPTSALAERDRHAAVGLGFGRLFVWGGCCEKGRARADGAIYRPGPWIRPRISRDLAQVCGSIQASVTVRCPTWLPAPATRDGRRSFDVSNADFDRSACSYLTELHAGPGAKIASYPWHIWIGGHCRPLPLPGVGEHWPPAPLTTRYFALVAPSAEVPGRRRRAALVRPRVVAVTSVHGRRAIILAVRPHPAGGVHGGHYAVVWNEDGEGYALSLHYQRGDSGKPPSLSQIHALTRAAASMRAVGR